MLTCSLDDGFAALCRRASHGAGPRRCLRTPMPMPMVAHRCRAPLKLSPKAYERPQGPADLTQGVTARAGHAGQGVGGELC